MAKWIMYTEQNVPNSSTEFVIVSGLMDAKDKFKEYCEAVGTDDCVGRLYPHDTESIALANEFMGIGNPFDYPSGIIERGPHGGAVLRKA